ncbi:MAG: oligosaccharide flippase family protein [Pseudomonadota bacterium]
MRRPSFLRNVGILTLGTLFSQVVVVAALPLLTRLYGPDDFDLLAVYAALIGIFSVAACLRYNIAVPLPETDEDGFRLLVLACGSALTVFVALSIGVWLLGDHVAAWIGQARFAPYLWLVPLGVLAASLYDALQYWATRKQRFGLITTTRMTRAVGGTGIQLGYGLVAPAPFGLLLGHLAYSGLGVIGLGRSILRHDRLVRRGITRAELWQTARRYKRYPLQSVPEAFLNTAGAELPIIIIAAVALGPEAGFLMLAMRVMGLPMTLIGASIAQVYLAEAPHRLRAGDLVIFTRRTIGKLFVVGAPPLIAVGIAAPFLAEPLLGEGWARTGTLIAWLTPLFVLQLASSPVSMVLHIVGRVDISLMIQAVGAALRIGAVGGAAWLAPEFVSEAFAIAGAMFYVLYILFILHVLKRHV